MIAVVRQITEAQIAERRRLGIDKFDEAWEGVLHMGPAPSNEHQRIVGELCAFLLPLIKRSGRGTLALQINVYDDPALSSNYRIPDLTFVAAGREFILAPDGTRGGGPDAVIEIRSPDDETYEKFPFYAKLAVREIVVIDRDTKKPEAYRLAGAQYLAIAADREGWVTAEVPGLRLRLVEGKPLKVAVEDLKDPSARTEI